MFIFNWRGNVDSSPLELLDLYTLICVMPMKPLVQYTLCRTCVASALLQTHSMFFRWMHPDQSTQRAALRDCAHWRARQKQLNSLWPTTSRMQPTDRMPSFHSAFNKRKIKYLNCMDQHNSLMMFNAIYLALSLLSFLLSSIVSSSSISLNVHLPNRLHNFTSRCIKCFRSAVGCV